MSVLYTTNVTKIFGGLVAVNRVDFQVAEREIASIIGPNGAGKTTFFNCLTGYYTPDQGEIHFAHRPLKGLRPDQIAGLGIARTYQNIRLFGGMTAIENVLVGQHVLLKSTPLGAILRTGSTRREEHRALERARHWLDFAGLGGRGDFLARNLPYGDQRRLEVARALASEPKLLLLDEPAAGMNPRETDRMMSLVYRIRDELGMTILLIEHDMRVVMNVSDSITVLDHGEKIAEGKPEEIRANPLVIEAYLGSAMADELKMAG